MSKTRKPLQREPGKSTSDRTPRDEAITAEVQQSAQSTRAVPERANRPSRPVSKPSGCARWDLRIARFAN